MEKLGLKLPAGTAERLCRYYGLLAAAKINLSGIKGPVAVAEKHFVDSLAVLTKVSLAAGERLLDVGTGAGLPGIPLAIAVPNAKVVLLEAVRKKVGFLEGAVRELELENVKVVWGRAEEFGRKEGYREAFGIVTARAVAPLRELVEYTLPFVRLGGLFVAWKGPKAGEEIQEALEAIGVLGGKLQGTEEYRLPLGGDRRCLVIVLKEKPTALGFPRRVGVARRKPLGRN